MLDPDGPDTSGPEIGDAEAQRVIGCGRKLGPYDCCTVVCGDCLELMKALPDGCVDAVIADPPYGLGTDTRYATNKRGGVDYPLIYGDEHPFDPGPFLGFPRVVLWGANHYANKLPNSPSWLVWHKRLPNNSDINDQADVELAWSNCGGPARHFHYTWNGFLRDGEREAKRQHPTQKPIELMAWCIERAGRPEPILDPFLGSGTTAVAAKKLGRHFLGFEISPDYCRIAEERIALVEMQPQLFEKRPEQGFLEIGKSPDH